MPRLVKPTRLLSYRRQPIVPVPDPGGYRGSLIPVALPTQLDKPTQAASDPPRHVVYKVGGGHLEPELSSEPEKAHHRQAMTQMEKIAS